MKRFFIMSEENKQVSTIRDIADDLKSAREKAQKLADQNPPNVFAVAEVVASFKAEIKVIETEGLF